MIGRRGKLLIALYIVFLVILFLMCSTDLIIREPEKEIYQIAVIIEDAKSDNYVNFRKGMDQAAMEFNADVHFITLYEKRNAKQQTELMERERQDGADALIVVPADEEQAAGLQPVIPVIFLRSGQGEGAGAGSIITDYKKMGEQIAHEMLKDSPADSPVLMLGDMSKQSTVDSLFLEGAKAVYGAAGRSWQIGAGKESVRASLEALTNREGAKVVILAGNPDILTEAAGILADNPAIADRVQGLYGRGGTLPILNYLDRGLITGICVTDEYGVGYLSVRMAVQALEGAFSQLPEVMDSYYVRKEDLRKPVYEKMLYPIE